LLWRAVMSNDRELFASVIIPVSGDIGALEACLESLARQDFENREVLIVCDEASARAVRLPGRSPRTRIIREEGRCTSGRLICSGMEWARGQVRVLLAPWCVPVGTGWLRAMVEPFRDERVGAVVSQCFPQDGAKPGLPARLMEAVEPHQNRARSAGLQARETVSGMYDAYRASALTETGCFADERLDGPAGAIDASLKIAAAGYSIVQSGTAVADYHVPESRRSLAGAIRGAVCLGRADAMLTKQREVHWLNGGVYAAALLSLFLLPAGAASLPGAVLFGLGLCAWGWFLTLRAPVLRWEVPMAVVNFAAYVGIVLLVRKDWSPSIFGTQVHPAIIRQWCWLAAVSGSYWLVVMLRAAATAVRVCAQPAGTRYALPALLLGLIWWLVAGAGYLHGRLFPGDAGKE